MVTVTDDGPPGVMMTLAGTGRGIADAYPVTIIAPVAASADGPAVISWVNVIDPVAAVAPAVPLVALCPVTVMPPLAVMALPMATKVDRIPVAAVLVAPNAALLA